MPLESRQEIKESANSSIQGNPAIAIIGNLKVGKSSLFSQICKNEAGHFQMPGTMVSVNMGHIRGTASVALDTPGIFSIFSTNEDERTSRDIFLPGKTGFDINGIVLVADAKNLKRSIAIALRYAEYDIPMLLDVNMIDEATARGITIDTEKLSAILGMDVFTTIARDGIGVSKLIAGLSRMRAPGKLVDYPDWLERFLDDVSKLIGTDYISPRAIGILLLIDDSSVEAYIEGRFGHGMLEQLKDLAENYRKDGPEMCSILLTNLYVNQAEKIIREIQVVEPPSKNPFMIKMGDWCTQLSTGVPIAVAVLYMMYLFVGSFGATFLVDLINGHIFEGFLIPWTTKLIDPIPSVFFRDMIADPDFGILPTGVFLAMGLVLPVLFCFYIAFGILEDSGYLPRLSMLLDKVFHKMGLNGKGVIPLVMGFSCVTMAILTTRMLDSKKEKNIATFLLLLGMPCAPLLAVMFIILGKMPVSAAVTVFGLIFLQIFIAGFLANKILPGRHTPFLMEIPPLRIPKLLQVIRTAASKTYFFMKEAVPVFMLASLIVFLFERMGGLEVLERLLKPVINGFMGLPEKSVQVFIKTIIRRESGAVEIEHLSSIYDNVQLVVNLLVMTFLTPCMNAMIVLFKERGTKTAVVIIGTVIIYAVLIGSMVNYTCRFLGVTFS